MNVLNDGNLYIVTVKICQLKINRKNYKNQIYQFVNCKKIFMLIPAKSKEQRLDMYIICIYISYVMYI